VLAQQGLGKYCDMDLVRFTSREMQEALEMTSEEMDYAAHELITKQDKQNFSTLSTTNIDRFKQFSQLSDFPKKDIESENMDPEL
jgi:hypothetical protein